jgi:hypothetical protein
MMTKNSRVIRPVMAYKTLMAAVLLPPLLSSFGIVLSVLLPKMLALTTSPRLVPFKRFRACVASPPSAMDKILVKGSFSTGSMAHHVLDVEYRTIALR